MRTASIALLSFLAAGCGAGARPCEPRQADPKGFTLADGEYELESTLHQLDVLDPKIYPFQDAPGDPIAICTSKDRDVMAKKLAFKLILGKALAEDKVVEKIYYEFLSEGSPPELIPVVQLRRYYKEALLNCLLNSSKGTPQAATDQSNISILTASNFDTETSRGIVVVDLMTHWCGPCKEMVPHLEKLAQDYKGTLRVGRLNLARGAVTAERFNVKTLPTIIILNNGKEISRTEKGFSGYAEFQKWTQGALQGLGGEQSVPVD